MCDFQARLDETERLSCVKEVEVSGALPFVGTGGKSGLRLREMTACVVLLSCIQPSYLRNHFATGGT